jgi:hypothetical protein
VVIWRNTVPAGVFLAIELAKVGVPLNSIWLQNLAKKGSEFFSVAKEITSKSPNLAKSPTKKNPGAKHTADLAASSCTATVAAVKPELYHLVTFA